MPKEPQKETCEFCGKEGKEKYDIIKCKECLTRMCVDCAYDLFICLECAHELGLEIVH